MRKNLTEIVFILDRSGSMNGLEKDTIGGYNSLLEKQRKANGEVMISTILFDDCIEVLHNRVPLDEIKDITEEEYYVRGCTALLDAIGLTIQNIKKQQECMTQEERPGKTLFIITTDGMENSSHRYTYSAIKELIDCQKEGFGWEFLFLGANMDAIAEAGRFGIEADRAVSYKCDAKGTEVNFSVLSQAISKVRQCETVCMEAALFGWKEEIEEDYRSREQRNKRRNANL